MTATITHALGKFVWHELYTPDAEAAKRFYADVFGWTWADAPMEGFTYRLASHGGKQIAGLMAFDQMANGGGGMPPSWGTYVSVDDVDAGAKRVEAAGGTVMIGPMDIPLVGRFAMFQDPQGAVTALYRANEGDGPDDEPTPGQWAWESLMTTDVAGAVAFYQAVVGWGAKAMDDGVSTRFTRADGAKEVANVAPAPPDRPPHWLSFVLVEDSKATCAKIEAAGGTIAAPTFEIPGVGFITVAQDPKGAVFCIWQPG